MQGLHTKVVKMRCISYFIAKNIYLCVGKSDKSCKAGHGARGTRAARAMEADAPHEMREAHEAGLERTARRPLNEVKAGGLPKTSSG